eukprot:COSAG06_NODE_4263_length_4421_cov_38.991208_5_plen_44_part_00
MSTHANALNFDFDFEIELIWTRTRFSGAFLYFFRFSRDRINRL